MKLGVFCQNLGNPIVYYPRLAKATGGVAASILFWQLFQWQSKLGNYKSWVRVTIDEIEKETGLTPTEQELARRELVKRSLLKERLVTEHFDTLEFCPDIDALEKQLNDCWMEAFHVPSFNPKDEVSLQKSSFDKPDLVNNQNNLDSVVTTETIVEAVKPTKVEKNGYSALSRHTPTTEQSGTGFDSSSTHTAVEVVDNACKTTRITKTDRFFPVQRQPIAVKVSPNYQFSGPWETIEQFEEFQRALLEYAKNLGFNSPSGWVFKIVDDITKGLVSPFWDEFVSGIPLGESQKVKRDWEIEPGVPYPAFEEEHTQYYVHKGEPLEVAVSKARSDLRNPVIGKDLWEGFLRKCDRIADDAIRAKKLGVATPYLPPSFSNKPQITKESVITKLSAITPKFSLAPSSAESLAQRSLESQEIKDENPEPVADAPSLSALQEVYKTPMGRTLVQKQIAEHPEWGYGIVDDQVVDLLPF
ncbi:hypothetical protein H6F98_27775 [Microcoleus sp. FACHB-SPT15]|nr:hypothetical protein [Microcoleus sp. FACHB-SPT15]